jgi:glutamate-ammonia-ligase adenylyltransferase
MDQLGKRLRPCGPSVDVHAAERLRESLISDIGSEPAILKTAWPALEPAFAASPYLNMLARTDAARLIRIITNDPDEHLDRLLRNTLAVGHRSDIQAAQAELRHLKSELHLLTALCDLGMVWPLEDVTRALSQFADAALEAALRLAVAEQIERAGGLDVENHGPLPGFFCIAMGKHGAYELNYSSDIDIMFFYDPEVMPRDHSVDASTLAIKISEKMSSILQRRTPDGYVFRVDLRLRPDPLSTPIAVSVNAAHIYYESVGQNWERAALIKARFVAGDVTLGRNFLRELSPFLWRKNLDFAAIADIKSILSQIQSVKGRENISAADADIKLGPGGIREIELFVQTQQLILGGRHPELRSPRTIDALHAMAVAEQTSASVLKDLSTAYENLRNLEHRAQMIADEQTHRMPADDHDRSRIAALAGYTRLQRFDADLTRTLRTVNRHCQTLFADEEQPSSRFGRLAFTGIDDDPETLATLVRMGFEHPGQVSSTIRGWHHGHVSATRTERGRELLTRLTPKLLEAIHASGAPDLAFMRFSRFFSGLSMGVQVQSLLLNRPRMLELLVRLMAFGPRFAGALARYPATLDALLDPSFFRAALVFDAESIRIDPADEFESVMNSARRAHREHTFRIGVHVIAGIASAVEVGLAFTSLADTLIALCARAALAELKRKAGGIEGDVAVVALGKCGSREMSAGSDLDLMTIYLPKTPTATSAISGLGSEIFYTRFTQRLIAALSAPTAEGGMYEVDLQLRPSGTKGPVAVSMAAFENYYSSEAEVWELLALTRARVVWSSSRCFGARVSSAVEAAIRRPRDQTRTARSVHEMRALLAKERPPRGFWDLKLSDGGLVDIEFTAQYLQLINAQTAGPLLQNTGEALSALAENRLAPARAIRQLLDAWRLQQDLSQLLKVTLDDGADPDSEPAALQAMLAKAGQATSFARLRSKLDRARISARRAFVRLV